MIVSIPGKLCGQPHIEGTRIPTKAVMSFFNAGYSVAEIIEQYPDLSREQVEAAIRFESGRPPFDPPEFLQALCSKHFRGTDPEAVLEFVVDLAKKAHLIEAMVEWSSDEHSALLDWLRDRIEREEDVF